MQQVNVLHVYPGVLSPSAPISSLMQQRLKEIIEKGGHRIVSVVPCGTSEGIGGQIGHDFVVVTERQG